MADLSPKQRMFCQEYIIDLNQTQAAIRAGYSPKTANEQASRLLANVNIKEYVQSLMDERIERTEITADYVLNGIKDSTEALKADGDHAATFKGYELLGKHLKMFTDKVEHSGQIALGSILQDIDGRSSGLPEDQG